MHTHLSCSLTALTGCLALSRPAQSSMDVWKNGAKIRKQILTPMSNCIHAIYSCISKEQRTTRKKLAGTRHPLQGFLSVHRRCLAELDPTKTDITHGDLGKSHMVHILGCLQKYTRAIWLHHNDLLHRKQQAKPVDIQTELDATIKHYSYAY